MTHCRAGEPERDRGNRGGTGESREDMGKQGGREKREGEGKSRPTVISKSRRLCYFDAVTAILVSAASVRLDGTLQGVEATGTDVCPRWSCPCVTSQNQALFFAKRQDPTSNFRRTTLSAAREALNLTRRVLHRIVSNTRHHV